MKKIIALVATVAMVLSVSVFATANPGQNPNQNPGSPQKVSSGVTVTVTGGGNNLVLRFWL